MRVKPIKLITTLTKREISELNNSGHTWIPELLKEKTFLDDISKVKRARCDLVLDAENNIVIRSFKDRFERVKIVMFDGGFVSLSKDSLRNSKIVSYLNSDFGFIPNIIKERLFPNINIRNKAVSLVMQKVYSKEKDIDTESLILKGQNSRAMIKRSQNSVRACVRDLDNNILYIGGSNNIYPSVFQDIKKDVFSVIS